MNKKILKILVALIFALAIFSINKSVQANTISSIDMEIYVDTNGNAQVTETWKCNVNSGTEVYHPYYNLGNSKITDLTVSEGTTKYTVLSSWNTSNSFNEKAYKCGINKISNGIELCWGISKYGSHTYVAKYYISNFVSQLNDAQMIYWTLIPYDFSTSIGSMNIKIYADNYIADTIDVWGYGNYGGLCYVNNGAIYMQSNGSLSTSEYMTILAKFPTGTFNASNKLNKDFNYYYEMAEEGATKYDEGSYDNVVLIVIILIIMLSIPIIVVGIVLMSGGINNGLGYASRKRKLSKEKNYFRDIPCNGDIFKSYYIGYTYGIIKKKTDLLGALILKWLKEEKAKIQEIDPKGLKKKENAIVLVSEQSEFENSTELKLYNMLYEASKDGILEKKEFEKWCKSKYDRILNWFDDILKEEREKLVEEGEITKEEIGKIKIFKSTKYEVTDKLTEQANQLAGLKKYLKDYTLIKEREAIEVTLFEEYLIYAQMMGIAKQVAKDFKDLYPEVIEASHYNSYDNILFIHYCSADVISSANNAKAAAENYSSGGGGFSSGGGGGGSFGGRRRPEAVSVKR